eukprot:UN06976
MCSSRKIMFSWTVSGRVFPIRLHIFVITAKEN